MEPKDIMLVSPNTVKAGSYITNDVSDEIIGSSIREVQDIHLQSIVGSNLLNALQTLVYNKMKNLEDTIDDDKNEAYKTLLDDYVTPYMVNKVQAAICLPITFKIRNMGVIQNSDTNVNKSYLSDIYAVQRRFNTMADRYATFLSMFLCERFSDFPELKETSCGCGAFVPAQVGKRFVNVGLNLDKGGKPCCK